MKIALIAAAACAAVSLTPVAATAMVNATPDNAHPEAGALYFSETATSARHFACSGALIDTSAFLTAAHCFADYYRSHGQLPVAWVTFDQRPSDSSTFYQGSISIDPAFLPKLTNKQNVYANDTNDIAVVHLSQSPGIAPATLPKAGQLNQIPRNQTFDVLGLRIQRDLRRWSPRLSTDGRP